jgi:hypothetical protein
MGELYCSAIPVFCSGKTIALAISAYALNLTEREFLALELVYTSQVNRSKPLERFE